MELLTKTLHLLQLNPSEVKIHTLNISNCFTSCFKKFTGKEKQMYSIFYDKLILCVYEKSFSSHQNVSKYPIIDKGS